MMSLRPWLAMVVMTVLVPVMPGSGPGAATADYLHIAPYLLEGDSFSSGEILGGPYDGCALDLQHDCNMVLYPTGQAEKQIWSTNTGGLGTDCNLIIQNDCNAVLYVSGTQTALWATGTAGYGSGCAFVVLPSGNVVLYDVSGNVLWSAGTGL